MKYSTKYSGGLKMIKTPQQKAWETRRRLKARFEINSLCIICQSNQRRKNAKTCDQHCAGKLAWKTRTSLY